MIDFLISLFVFFLLLYLILKEDETYIKHYEQLRRNLKFLLITSVPVLGICFYYSPKIIQHFINLLDDPNKVTILHPMEGIITRLNVTLSLFSLYLVFGALICVYIWINDALYKHEKSTFLKYIILFLSITVIACIFGTYVIIPSSLYILPKLSGIDINQMYSLEKYMDFVFGSLIITIFAFYIPIFISALIKLNVITKDQFNKSRPLVYVFLYAVLAALTPDTSGVITMMMYVPLICINEILLRINLL